MASPHALVLTDIVDSTQLAMSLGEAAMRSVWLSHDLAARDLLRRWRGTEIEKTDGLLCVFEAVEDAVEFAVGYHRELARLVAPLQARVGLHLGQIELRRSGKDEMALGAAEREVIGIAKPTVARVMSLALGRQTLMTADARLALGATAWRVQAHGHWRMKGFPEAFELFEIGDESAPFIPPSDVEKAYRVVRRGDLWTPVRHIAHNLPAERDRFVGRVEQLAVLAAKLHGDSRLVSVLGMGGAGKTRLAVRFAWTWLGEWPGGAWFCDLSQATTLEGIYFAVAQSLDIPLGKTDPALQLAQAIAGRGRCLIVFDNFEQVARHAESTIGLWLDRSAEAKFVVTTREVLGIAGEDTLVLGPMPVADSSALFLRRAEAVQHDYRPADEELRLIAQLVLVLDGLPLAIELAAARTRIMTPEALLARMNERFRILRSAGGRHDRRATLQATLDWSWDLLTEFEKAALAQLSVFEGGFTVESAEAVVDFGSLSPLPWLPDVIQALVDKSFVRSLAGDRFHLLESVREYAAQHLTTPGRFAGSSPSVAEATEARHYRYFASFDESAAIANDGIELNNLVAACRRACARDDARSAVGALSASWAGLRLRGPFQVALQLAGDVEALPSLPDALRPAVDWVHASALDSLGQRKRSAEKTESGHERALIHGDDRLVVRFKCRMAEQWVARDPAASQSMLDEAKRIADVVGDDRLKCTVLAAMGNVSLELGRVSESKLHYREALEFAVRVNDIRQQGGLLGNIAIALMGEGELAQAKLAFERCLAILRQVGDRRWEGNMRCNLGMLHLEMNRPDLAAPELEAALASARSMGHARLECTVLCNLGIAFERQGDIESARRRYEEAVDLAAILADRRSEGQFRGYLGLLLASTGHVDAGLACLGEGERLLLEASDQWSLGLLLCRRAEAEHRFGRAQDAVHAVRRIESIVGNALASPTSELGKALAELSIKLDSGRQAQDAAGSQGVQS